jgi:hypothetical protein
LPGEFVNGLFPFPVASVYHQVVRRGFSDDVPERMAATAGSFHTATLDVSDRNAAFCVHDAFIADFQVKMVAPEIVGPRVVSEVYAD